MKYLRREKPTPAILTTFALTVRMSLRLASAGEHWSVFGMLQNRGPCVRLAAACARGARGRKRHSDDDYSSGRTLSHLVFVHPTGSPFFSLPPVPEEGLTTATITSTGLTFQIPGIWHLSWIFSPSKFPISLQITSKL